MLADPKGSVERFAERYGPVFRTRAFGGRVVTLIGPQANKFVLLDQAKLFCSLTRSHIQAKCFAYHLLSMSEISARPKYRPEWNYWPIPGPNGGLQVKLASLR